MAVKQIFFVKTVNRVTLFQCLILLIFSLSSLLYSSAGNTEIPNNIEIKALYTYKIGKFTQWPSSKLNLATKKFEYCILGTPPFSQMTMNTFIGKTIQDIPISISVFASGLIPEDVLSACHIVFISRSEKRRLSTLIRHLKTLPILTISDIPNFSHRGGMITLTEQEGNLRFIINSLSLKHAGIYISSKIMEIAEIIDNGDRI